MELKVLFFSLLRDVVGADEITRAFPGKDSVDVGEFLESLYSEWPDLRTWDRSLLVAADCRYVDRDAELVDGQEIAVMPPVQGG